MLPSSSSLSQTAHADGEKVAFAFSGCLQICSLPGAVHSFTNPGATAIGKKFILLAYHAEADAQSWAELETFLHRAFAD